LSAGPDTGDVLLWRLPPDADAVALWALATLQRSLPGLRIYRADDGLVHAYLWAAPAAAELAARLPQVLQPGSLPMSRFTCTRQLAGAAAGRDAPWFYVVETDVLPEHEADFNAWYEQEHLPGLAAVPGTVSASRLRDPLGHPRYHACYELASHEAFNSPAWLAVRGTPWSSRVRPSFRNTRRTMFQRWQGPR
jgi:hypothetical protein